MSVLMGTISHKPIILEPFTQLDSNKGPFGNKCLLWTTFEPGCSTYFTSLLYISFFRFNWYFLCISCYSYFSFIFNIFPLTVPVAFISIISTLLVSSSWTSIQLEFNQICRILLFCLVLTQITLSVCFVDDSWQYIHFWSPYSSPPPHGSVPAS